MNYYYTHLIAHLLHTLHNRFFKNLLLHYSYDIHGNVKTLWQDNKQLADDYPSLANQRFKKLDYKYDLISGNVKMVSYQADSLDAFHHRYEYDADNRITEVSTSRLPNKMLAVAEVAIADAWNKDAKYFYYDHGPLARVELGHNKVQGIDYAYTLQGWLKAVNSETLDTLRDIGRDADQTAGNSNANFPKDVFGYSLNYFNGDYASITNNNFLADKTNLTNLASDAPNLYNGNINYMVTGITNPLTRKPLPQLTAYKYDQLNRLLQMKAFDSVDFAANQWEYQNYDNKYFNSFRYDGNGNILTQHRRNAAGKTINHLTYNRLTVNNELVQNRLYHVNDTVDDLRFADDIDDQGVYNNDIEFVNTDNNYAYDEIGNLTRNTQKEIEEITWTVTGKVKEVTRSLGSSKKNLRFEYDALGNRTAKYIYDNNWTLEKSEFYFRDATGNVMSIYTLLPDAQQQAVSYAQTETFTYGSSRVATNKETTELISPLPQGNIYSNKLGYKHFELTNHLGNILTTVSDIKEQQDYNSNNEVDCYTAQILSNSDYYPFGVSMTERSYNNTGRRYSFNGKENDYETETMDFGARLLDGDLGVWLAVDPLFGKYPFASPYNFVLNTPIIAIDPDGKEVYIIGAEGNDAAESEKNKEQATLAFSDLQKRVPNLLIERNTETGKIDYKGLANPDKKLKYREKHLLAAIQSNEVKANVEISSTFIFAGSYMGSKLTDGKAISLNVVNLEGMRKLEGNKKGKGMLHEITEGFEAGLILLRENKATGREFIKEALYNVDVKTGEEKPKFPKDMELYEEAHINATKAPYPK